MTLDEVTLMLGVCVFVCLKGELLTAIVLVITLLWGLGLSSGVGGN